MKRNDRNGQTIAHLGWSQRAAHPDNEIDIARTWVRPERLDEQICVSGIARDNEVGFETADGHHPAKLLHQITVLLKHPTQGLAVGEISGFRPPSRLSEFLLYRQPRIARLDTAECIDIGSGHSG